MSENTSTFPIPTLVDMEFDDGTFYYEFSTQMSKDRMMIETNRIVPENMNTVLRFSLPNLDWVFEIQAKIAKVKNVTPEEKLDGKKNCIDLNFVSMDNDDEKKLFDYMRDFKIEDLEL